jgi:hypothetical protein
LSRNIGDFTEIINLTTDLTDSTDEDDNIMSEDKKGLRVRSPFIVVFMVFFKEKCHKNLQVQQAPRSTMKIKALLKPMDFAVLALSLAMTLGSGFVLYSDSESGLNVIIRGSGRSWVFPLEAEERIAVPGPLGETVVEIRGGQSRVLSSPCANQTCVAAGHIGRPGNWTACLPNRVFVSIEGGADEENRTVDAAAW